MQSIVAHLELPPASSPICVKRKCCIGLRGHMLSHPPIDHYYSIDRGYKSGRCCRAHTNHPNDLSTVASLCGVSLGSDTITHGRIVAHVGVHEACVPAVRSAAIRKQPGLQQAYRAEDFPARKVSDTAFRGKARFYPPVRSCHLRHRPRCAAQRLWRERYRPQASLQCKRRPRPRFAGASPR